jgi:16S rRNA (uracil1498-N3)-methyltransferase
VAAEALKQCRRSHLPEIGTALGIDAVAAPGRRLIVADRAGGPAAPGRPQPTTIVIGPEGGLTDDELAALDRAGAHRVRLAGPILRIETAALAAAAVWASAWEHAAP